MKPDVLVFVLVFMLCSAHAQTIMGFNVTEIARSVSTGLKGAGLVPDLQNVNSEDTKAFVIILVLVWMIFNIALSLPDLPSAVVSFFATSFLFNNVHSLFVPVTSMGLFEYVFSALFVFIWVDYLLHYVWALSRTTKLFVDAAVTMMAVMFMNFINIFNIMSWWISWMLSTTGFVLFMVFMAGLRIFNTYFSLMNLRSVRALRRGAGAGYTAASKSAKDEVDRARIGTEKK